MGSEGSPSVNHIPPIVIYDPVLAVARYVTGSVLTNSTPIDAKIVDGDGTQITSFGGGTQYAVDAALGSTPTGTLAIAIRDDALSALTPIEGDAIGLRVDANGALWVIPSGTTVVSATDLDIRNLVAATDIVTVTGGAGQTADVKITLDGESVAVTGTFWQATQPVSIAQDVALGTDISDVFGTASLILATQADDVVNTSDGIQTSSFLYVFDGSTWDRLKGDSTDGMLVNLGANNDVVVSATNLDIRDLTSASDNVAVVGTIADDSTTPGDPVMVGGFAVSIDGTTPGAVAEADVARFRTDLNRRLLVNDDHPQWLNYQENSSSALTDTAVFADPGDGFQIVVTSIIVSTGAATAMNFFLEEGVTTVFGPIYLEAVAGRGFVSGPIKKHITASTALTITTSAAIAHSISIQGYIQAV